MTSIRGTLLAWLLAGLAAVAVLATVLTYMETKREVGALFDLQLKQLAFSTRIDDLLRGRSPSLSQRDGNRAAGVSEIVTQIWDRDGVLVYWSQPGAGLPVPATEGYTNVTRDGREWRIYTHVAGNHALQVAHALDERREIAAQTALRTLLPFTALIPLLGVLIWYAVGRGLRPLDTMSRAVAKRRPDAMAPLAEGGLPRELKPLAGSLNALLARLDDALSAQRRFTADAAHELRTPLAALALQVELAERSAEGGARATAFAELKAGVDRAAHLVEQLLTMARLEPEAPARAFVSIDLAGLVREAVVARAALAADKEVDLGMVRASEAPVHGDAASLAMLIANLLDNALRYTPSGGRVDVAVDNDVGHALLSVIDTGPGIARANRERVFERFHRGADGDGAANATGSGLGLSIVRRIADAHGATVQLDDGPGGRGLAARVRFPRPNES
ncbi:MAG: two-component sensor histidine kinase [Burkholderiales bacterium]|nr:two-component sensor histidine kinase [Burkholderiales bacterium]